MKSHLLDILPKDSGYNPWQLFDPGEIDAY